MKARCLLGAVTLAATLAIGCDSSEKEKKAAPGDGNGNGTRTQGDAAPAPATVFLRIRVAGDRALLDVIARNASRDVHGAAFRLGWAPERLTFVEAHVSDAWSSSAIHHAKEGLPGELVVVWSEKGGAAGVPASDETTLGTIELAVKTPGPTDVTFRADRSTLRDATGAAIPVEWRGGQLAAPRD